jgi:hypothetical protein
MQETEEEEEEEERTFPFRKNKKTNLLLFLLISQQAKFQIALCNQTQQLHRCLFLLQMLFKEKQHTPPQLLK